jgi:hypothetical protein
MTTPIIPEFILKLFQTEVSKIVDKEIEKLCKIYDIDFEEAKKKLGNTEIKMTTDPGFKIVRNQKKIPPKQERCIARMFHGLEIKQCTRAKCNKKGFCGLHINTQLRYGTINDPLPNELRPEVLNEKKKNSIY